MRTELVSVPLCNSIHDRVSSFLERSGWRGDDLNGCSFQLWSVNLLSKGKVGRCLTLWRQLLCGDSYLNYFTLSTYLSLWCAWMTPFCTAVWLLLRGAYSTASHTDAWVGAAVRFSHTNGMVAQPATQKKEFHFCYHWYLHGVEHCIRFSFSISSSADKWRVLFLRNAVKLSQLGLTK